jgi:hypothetical protein
MKPITHPRGWFLHFETHKGGRRHRRTSLRQHSGATEFTLQEHLGAAVVLADAILAAAERPPSVKDVVFGAVEIDGGRSVLVSEASRTMGISVQVPAGPVTDGGTEGARHHELRFGRKSPRLAGATGRHPLEDTAFTGVTAT